MRPDRDTYFMALALVASRRTTCARRGVGCVLVDARGNELALGYNGVAAGMPHCHEGHPCRGVDLPPGQDSCEAVHAETNALLKCSDRYEIDTAYVTLSPCLACVKLLLNTSCRRIVFLERHPRSDEALALWVKSSPRVLPAAPRTWDWFTANQLANLRGVWHDLLSA